MESLRYLTNRLRFIVFFTLLLALDRDGTPSNLSRKGRRRNKMSVPECRTEAAAAVQGATTISPHPPRAYTPVAGESSHDRRGQTVSLFQITLKLHVV